MQEVVGSGSDSHLSLKPGHSDARHLITWGATSSRVSHSPAQPSHPLLFSSWLNVSVYLGFMSLAQDFLLLPLPLLSPGLPALNEHSPASDQHQGSESLFLISLWALWTSTFIWGWTESQTVMQWGSWWPAPQNSSKVYSLSESSIRTRFSAESCGGLGGWGN